MLARIVELFDIIKQSKKEVEEIQDKCVHENREMCDYMWAPGHISKGLICKECHKYLG